MISLRIFLVSASGVMLGLMVSTIFELKRIRVENRNAVPAPTWVNALFAFGHFLLVLSVGIFSIHVAQQGGPTIGPGTVVGVAGMVVSIVSHWLLLRTFRRNHR